MSELAVRPVTPRCRICLGWNVERVLDLGRQPHCNRFLRSDQLGQTELRYPLDVWFCHNCALVQLGFAVERETLFLDHPYVSGTTRTLTAHFDRLAGEIWGRRQLAPGALVVDIGSNDGTWLAAFHQRGARTVGVEPAGKIADLAEARGIETVRAFFGRGAAKRILSERGPASVVTAAGVFFHVDDLEDFVDGVKTLLAADGVFVVQAMYLLDIVERCAFDAVYHEHVCYYALRPLVRLFDRYEMEIVRAERHPIHGGSFIIDVANRSDGQTATGVDELLRLEEATKLYSVETYYAFAGRAALIKRALVALLRTLKADGKRIAAYGASARGNTMLNYCNIDSDVLEYAVEKNRLKVGLYTPGARIPVISEEEAATRLPDYFLVLPWNFLDEFLVKERRYLEAGGKFIVPIPEPRVL